MRAVPAMGRTSCLPAIRMSCRSATQGAWTVPPFSAEIRNGEMYGRGAVDMKGGIACFVAAVARHLEKNGALKGSISFVITGDEEGPSINGTGKLLEWAKARGEKWDAAIVGEPTNPDKLGDMIKIGRRGSLSGTVVVHGVQGHAAYPHLADNPVRGLVTLVDSLLYPAFDEGTKDFQADQSRSDHDRCRQPRGQRYPRHCHRYVQCPLQRYLDRRNADGGNS